MRIPLTASVAFAGAALGLVGLATLSYWGQPLAIDAVVIWSAFVMLAKPVAGWALAIFAVPFQSLFALSSDGFGRVRALLLLLLTPWALVLATRHGRYRSPMLWALLAFAVLLTAHGAISITSMRHPARDVLFSDTVFVFGLAAMYVVSREFGARVEGMALAQAAFVLSALAFAGLTFLFLYLPFPDLIRFHQPLDSLRLFGVQDNPNALAKLLVPSLLFLVCYAISQPRARRWGAALIFASGFLLAATETRSVLVALAVTLYVVLPCLNPANARRFGFWMVPSVAVLGCAAWTLGAPWLEVRATEHWIAHHEWNLCYYFKAHPSDPDSCRPKAPTSISSPIDLANAIENAVVRDLRFDVSYAMVRVDGKTEYERRPFSAQHIGQRDRTWNGGLTIAARHWAWGIGGPQQWARQMQQVVGYPFESPHNAWLEVVGGYGVPGALLYLLVVGLFVRNYAAIRPLAHQPWQRLANDWTFLAGVTVFLVEAVEVLTVFGVTINAIWFWVIAGLQAGLLDAVQAGGPRPAGAPARTSTTILGP